MRRRWRPRLLLEAFGEQAIEADDYRCMPIRWQCSRAAQSALIDLNTRWHFTLTAGSGHGDDRRWVVITVDTPRGGGGGRDDRRDGRVGGGSIRAGPGGPGTGSPARGAARAKSESQRPGRTQDAPAPAPARTRGYVAGGGGARGRECASGRERRREFPSRGSESAVGPHPSAGAELGRLP
jgi:hypothetical protein